MKRVPYVFVTGSVKDQLPAELQNVRFILKPFQSSQITNQRRSPRRRKRASLVTGNVHAIGTRSELARSFQFPREESSWKRHTLKPW